MKHLKTLGPIVMVVLAVVLLAGVSTASATTLQSGGKNLPAGTEIYSTLKAGTSSLWKDTFGTTVQTCTKSENKVKTSNETGATLTGVITLQSTSNCAEKAFVINNGEMNIEWTSGTNGKVIANGSETTFFSTFFGISCIGKAANTTIGTVTGSTTGNATMDINGVLEAGICGDYVWSATYTITSPSPLAVVK
jgi:hypothetical protein